MATIAATAASAMILRVLDSVFIVHQNGYKSCTIQGVTFTSESHSGMLRWIVGKYGDLIPLLAFVVVIGGVYVYDREKSNEIESVRREREASADRRAAILADALGNAINMRLGAMSTGELTFTTVEDSVPRRMLAAALDTITER